MFSHTALKADSPVTTFDLRGHGIIKQLIRPEVTPLSFSFSFSFSFSLSTLRMRNGHRAENDEQNQSGEGKERTQSGE